MQNRTRILITHHVQLCLPKCAYLVHLQNGVIDICGAPSTLGQEGLLSTLVNEQTSTGAEQGTKEDAPVDQETQQKDSSPQSDNHAQTLVEEECKLIGIVIRLGTSTEPMLTCYSSSSRSNQAPTLPAVPGNGGRKGLLDNSCRTDSWCPSIRYAIYMVDQAVV